MTLLAGMYFGTSSDYVNTRLVKSDNVGIKLIYYLYLYSYMHSKQINLIEFG